MTLFSKHSEGVPAILGGVRDQHERFWIRYGTQHRHVLFSIDELQANPNSVFAKLMGVGKAAITAGAKEEFRREVENFDRYDSYTLVDRVGWTNGSFLYPDGWHVPSSSAATNTLFFPVKSDPKAGWSGDLRSWQNAMSPFVRCQPLVLFAISYAFVGPLLSFAPPDLQNTIVELVGPPEKGKTTLGICVGSVWGGDPDSSCGFGVAWNLTPGSIDAVIESHRDHLLYLEEANQAGSNDTARAELLGSAFFRITGTEPRRRLVNPLPLVPARTAVLSTSNIPLKKLIRAKSDSDAAALSRVLSLRVDRQFGIFDTVPIGFVSASAAVRALHAAAVSCYGVAGRHFIQCLVGWNDRRSLRSDVADSFDRFLAHPAIARLGDGRHAKILAITCAAHEIASHFNVIPADWGSITDAVAALHFDAVEGVPPRPSAIDQLMTFARDQASNIVDIGRLAKPLTAQEFEQTVGIWIDRQRLLVPTDFFHRYFPGHRAMLQQLRSGDYLESEGGRNPKLSRKVPARVCGDHGRRAYFFKLPSKPN